MTKNFTIGWSDFALKRHVPKSGFSFSTLTNEQILKLVHDNWDRAIPGTGEKDLTRKILVPIPADEFYTSTILLTENCNTCEWLKNVERCTYPDLNVCSWKPSSSIHAAVSVIKRRPEEDLFIQNYITPKQAEMDGLKPEPANFVKIVCYSAEALSENDERSTDCEWEIISIVASPIENEPMPPLTMARNMLEKKGGTKSEYTAKEFAEAIYYWSQRIRIME